MRGAGLCGQTGGQRHRAFDEGSRPALSICPPLASSTGPGTGHSLPSSPTAFRASGRQGRGQGCPFHPCSRVAGLAVGPEALRPEPVHRPANRSSGRKTPLQGEGPQREAEGPRGWGHRALSEKHMAEGPFWSCETRVGSVGQPRCPDGGAGLGAPVLALGGAAGPEGAHCRDPVTPGLRPVRPTLSSPPHRTQTPVLTAHLLNAITSPGQPCEVDPNTHPQPDAKTGSERSRHRRRVKPACYSCRPPSLFIHPSRESIPFSMEESHKSDLNQSTCWELRLQNRAIRVSIWGPPGSSAGEAGSGQGPGFRDPATCPEDAEMGPKLTLRSQETVRTMGNNVTDLRH